MESWKLAGYMKEVGAVKKDGVTGSSGKIIKPYIDVRLALGEYNTQRMILAAISDSIDIEYDVVGGGGVGGSLLSATYSQKYRKNCVIIREQEKDHGLKKIIEGYYKNRDKIILLEDVLSTGNSLRRYYEKVKENSEMKIVGACAVVNGLNEEEFSKLQKDLDNIPIFTLSKREEYL